MVQFVCLKSNHPKEKVLGSARLPFHLVTMSAYNNNKRRKRVNIMMKGGEIESTPRGIHPKEKRKYSVMHSNYTENTHSIVVVTTASILGLGPPIPGFV